DIRTQITEEFFAQQFRCLHSPSISWIQLSNRTRQFKYPYPVSGYQIRKLFAQRFNRFPVTPVERHPDFVLLCLLGDCPSESKGVTTDSAKATVALCALEVQYDPHWAPRFGTLPSDIAFWSLE